MKKKTCQKCETKSKQIFCVSKEQQEVKYTVSCLRKANGQTTTCPKETADLLVESFASVFTREEALNGKYGGTNK